MQLFYIQRDAPSSPLAGPWNSGLQAGVSYIQAAQEQPHYHRQMREVGIVVGGSVTLIVAGRSQSITAGMVAVIEPGEIHAWIDASRDFKMVIAHEPWRANDTVVVAQA